MSAVSADLTYFLTQLPDGRPCNGVAICDCGNFTPGFNPPGDDDVSAHMAKVNGWAR